MRIGFDLTPLCGQPTGVGVYAAHVLAHIAPLLDEPIVSLAHRAVQWPVGVPRPATHQMTPPFAMNKTLWMQLCLPWQLHRAGVQLCHFTNSVAPLLSPVPLVVTLHDASLWLYPDYHYSRRLLTMRPLIPAVVRRARMVVTVSHQASRDLMRVLGLPREKIRVIYEAPSPFFRPLAPGAWMAGVRERYRLPERFVLYVGTLEPRKNLVRLVRAVARLNQEAGVACGVVLVGPRGWKDEAILAAVAEARRATTVCLLGYVPLEDVRALYNLAAVFAFPSLYEGFGLPVLEAMACGTPVITSRGGALEEVAGDAAMLVNPTDETEMVSALASVLCNDDLAMRLRAAGLARAAQFDWRRTAQETIALYRECVA
nr:glycosyltransferase family 1 protein [Ardenticatena sp.]